MIYSVRLQCKNLYSSRHQSNIRHMYFHPITKHISIITLKKHCVPPNRYIYLHRSNSWQLLAVTQKIALEQNFRVRASRYFVCMFHQIDKSTWIKMWFLQCTVWNKKYPGTLLKISFTFQMIYSICLQCENFYSSRHQSNIRHQFLFSIAFCFYHYILMRMSI